MGAVSLRLLLILAALSLGAESKTIHLNPDPANTLELLVEKTGVMSGKRHRFLFTAYSGKLDMDTSVSFTIQAASLVCTDTWVSAKDLKKIENVAKTDMLAIDRHPVLRFQSTEIRAIAPDRYSVRGNLEIRGIHKPVDVTVVRSSADYKGNAKIRLTDFGLKPPSAALGLVGTKETMDFNFTLVRKAE